MPQLLLKHSDLSSATAGSLEVGLSGYVPEKLIDEIDKELSLVRATFHDLEASLPPMRIEQGFWQFSASCPQIYFSEIFIQCFLDALEAVGFEAVLPKDSPVNFGKGSILFRISKEAADGAPNYRPFASEKVGGGGTEIAENPRAALTLLPDTIFHLGERNEMPVIFGVGWDAGRNKTYEMIHGTTAAPDLDLEVYFLNRFGEVADKVSPKTNRTGPGIQLSRDNSTGDAVGDDERCVVEVSKVSE